MLGLGAPGGAARSGAEVVRSMRSRRWEASPGGHGARLEAVRNGILSFYELLLDRSRARNGARARQAVRMGHGVSDSAVELFILGMGWQWRSLVFLPIHAADDRFVVPLVRLVG